MWRWLNNLPRVIRQQFYPTGASAGVRVDDNDALRKDSPDRKGHYGKLHSKAGHHRYHGRRGRFGRSSFWGMVHEPGISSDKLICGPVLTVGLQSHHEKVGHGTSDKSEGKKNCLFYRVAAALPIWNDVTSGFRILPQKGECSQTEEALNNKSNSKSSKPEVETLEAAFSNFERVCQMYTAVGQGIMASQAAQAGQMTAAVRLWQDSSRLGHGKSQFNLAVCYETGHGVKKDMSKAIEYYLAAAEDDHAMAMYNLALIYLEEVDISPGSTDKAIALLTRAADLGLPQAQKYLGVYYSEEEEDVAKSVFYLTKAANQNDAEAQYLLGICYECGRGLEENTCKAAHWYTRSAEAGNSDAMYSLAIFHQNGYGGLPENHKSAMTLFRSAADLGHEEARIQLIKLVKENSAQGKPRQLSSNPEVDGFLLKMNSCVSSPCITDLVREDISPTNKPWLNDTVTHFGSISHIFSQLMIPRALTELPFVKEIQWKSGSKSECATGPECRVSFTVGGYQQEQEDPEMTQSVGVVTPTLGCRQPYMHRKTATMPDLQVAACK